MFWNDSQPGFVRTFGRNFSLFLTDFRSCFLFLFPLGGFYMRKLFQTLVRRPKINGFTHVIIPNGNHIFTCSSLEFLFLLAAICGHLLRIRLPLPWSFLRRKRLPIGKPEISGTRKSVQYKSMIGNIDIHFIHWWRIEWQALCSSTTGRKGFDILDPIPCLVLRRAGHRSTIPFHRIHRPDWQPRRFEVFHAISAAIAIRIFYPDILRYRPEDFSQNGKYGQNLHTGFEKPIFRYRTTLVEKSRCCFRNGVFPMENRDSDIPNTLCSIVAFRDRTANLGRNKMFRRFLW